MAQLTTVTNPFDVINSREITQIESGKHIYEVVAGFYCFHDVVVSVNGQIISDYEYVVQDDDYVGFVAVPQKGGKNTLMLVAMIALTIAAPAAGLAAVNAIGATTALGYYGAMGIMYGVQLGVMVGGGMLINSLLAPSVASSTPTQSIESSPTYGWENAGNQSAEGISLPIIYGKARITPPVISQYVETVGNKQYLNILYALCDGAIASVSDIMINDNPISYYTDVVTYIRLGANAQTLIPSFDNTRVDNAVGAKLSTTALLRETSYNSVQGLKINISAPSGIYYANNDGGLDLRTVTLVIKYKKVGDATWITIPNTTISGASTSTIRATFTADGIPAGQYDISVARTTAESTTSRTQDKVYFEGFTEIIYDDFIYPSTALLAIKALATDQLSGSMPKVSCVVDRGAGTSNPAVAAQNILTLAGAEVNASLFNTWATYCTTQNFKCNIIFDSEINVREALNIVGMLGRANIIQMGAAYLPIIEKAEMLPIQRFLFTMGNIIKDSFKEEYLPLADRSNAVEVTYFDETLDYEKQSIELYQSGFDESTQTIRKASVTLYGCTNRTQATRHGRFLLHRNRYLTNTVSFEADVDAIACTIGDIIDVSHDVPQWGFSGRLKNTNHSDTWAYTSSVVVNGNVATEANTNIIQLDRDVDIAASIEYGIIVRLKDDSTVTVSIISSETLRTDSIPLPSSLNLSMFDVYAFGEISRISKLFRVASISRSSDQRRKISAIEYIPAIYNDYIDNVAIDNASALSTVSYLLVSSDTEVASDGRSINIINLTWSGQAIAWNVYGRDILSQTWILLTNTQNTYFQIKDVKAGGYSYKVGEKVVSTTVTIAKVPLANVQNFISFYQNNQLVLRWDLVTDTYRTPIWYEVRRGLSWLNSEVLGKITTNSIVIDSAGTYFVKAYYKSLDGVEVYSETETGIVVSSANILKNVVATWDEYATAWTGTKTNLTTENGNLILPAGTASGTYEIPTSHIVTLATAQLSTISIRYSASAGDESILFDSITSLDTWANLDGDVTGTWSVKPKISISQDGTTWGAWQDFVIGDYVGKAFKARLELYSYDIAVKVLCDGFTFTVDMPDRIAKGTAISIASGGTNIVYSYPFQTKPNTQITIVNATAGDDVKLTAETASGFTAQVVNGGAGVARTINYLAQGY
jgi:hypothetical protein